MSQRHKYDPVSSSAEATLVPTPCESRDLPSDRKMRSLSIHALQDEETQTTNSGEHVSMGATRTPTSRNALWTFFLDILLAIPALCFIIYGILASRNDGKPIDADPVPALRTASRYGPTVFPIVFSAVAANLLKAAAAWKLERGISVLSLEFLLKSRTVFNTLTSPFIIGAVNYLTPFLVVLWLLSPLGGQAALRVISDQPSDAAQPWFGQYLDFLTPIQWTATFSSAGKETLPAIVGIFVAALSAPGNMKAASQDLYGNIKVPLIEPFIESNKSRDADGWFSIDNDTDIEYSSLVGLPLKSDDTLEIPYNRSFVLESAYMYADCNIIVQSIKDNETGQTWGEWVLDMFGNPANNIDTFHNGKTLLVSTNQVLNYSDATPRTINFTTPTFHYLSNATCQLTTSYVEVDVQCQQSTCGPVRVRALSKPQNMTTLTVLDSLGPQGQKWWPRPTPMQGFLSAFVNSTDSPWSHETETSQYSRPLEMYIVDPEHPYNIPYLPESAWWGMDRWNVSNAVASRRFSQLLNTFWITSVSPGAAIGRFSCVNSTLNATVNTPVCQTSNGTMTPDILVLHVDRGWLLVLSTASYTMFFAALIAAGLGALRQGPEILDYAVTLWRYNAYTHAMEGGPPMEDGSKQTKRLKDSRVCLGYVKDERGQGIISLGSVEEAVPLGKKWTTTGGNRYSAT